MDGWVFIRLVHALRQVSVTISSQDILEALICLRRYPHIPSKHILKALFVHRPQEEKVFNLVWEIIVAGLQAADPEQVPAESSEQEFEKKPSKPGVGGQGAGRGSGGVSLTECGEKLETSPLARLIPYSRLEELAVKEKEFEEMVKSILAELDYYTWINAYDLAYQRGTLPEDQWYVHQGKRSSILAEVRQRALISQVKANNCWDPLLRQSWLVKPLSHLSEEEKELVRSSIRKWAKNLALRPGYRWQPSPKGVIDIPAVIRKSVQWDGYLCQLGYRRKQPRAPELVVLCDVSNSMAPFVEFLIYLVSCLRKGFRKIRVFFFIDAVWDVTDYVWDEDLGEVKEEIKSWGHKVSSGFSDYGAVFKEIAERYLKEVSSRALLMILGDAKNNYRRAQADYFAQIAQGVRRVYWLNPLEEKEWSEPDNVMKEYRDYCSKIYRCRTARDLQRIVKDVF